MRDQGTASEKALAIDFLHIDESDGLRPEDLDRLIHGIASPSTEIIDPTFATGQNTRVLISLCEKMSLQMKDDFYEAKQARDSASAAIKTAKLIAEPANKDEKKDKQDIAYSTVLEQIRDAELAKLRITTKYLDEMKVFGASLETMIKLGTRLLADQQEHGASIKTGKAGIKYAFTCKAIDGQWKAIKDAFKTLRKVRKAIEQLEEFRKNEKVMFPDTENDGKVVEGWSFEKLSEALATIVAEVKTERVEKE